MPSEQYEIRWKDYYQLLGVRPDADQDTIRRMFRRLSQIYHPDVAGGAAVDPDRMKELNEAREVLSDSERRSKYDQFYRSRDTNGSSSAGAATENSNDWEESDWQSTWDSPPIPNLIPENVDWGTISPQEIRSATFMPENLGGPASRYELTYYPNEPWLSVTMQGDNFPCPVYVGVNPSLLQPGRRYTAEVMLTLDGVTTSAHVRFQVASTTSPYEDYDHYEAEEPSEGWISELSYRFPPLRLLEQLAERISPRGDEAQRVLPWPSWQWQRLAIFGSIPMAIFFIVMSLPAAAWFLLVLSIVWLGATIYAGIVTGWLRATREAPSPARIVARACIIASGITYTIAAVSVVLFILFMIFFFRIGASLIKEWWEREKAK